MGAWEKENESNRSDGFSGGSVMGRITDVDGFTILVSVDGRPSVAARLMASVDRSVLSVDREVVLMFERNDIQRPIIIGVMENVLNDLVEMEVEVPSVAGKPSEARVDGKRIVFEADNEIELKCGKSSITLKKNGKIVIKGSELLTRASGTNRIKGGSVGIN